MQKQTSFSQGPILSRLLRFALPVLGAMVLQAMYGAADLLVVGRYADAAAVSAVSTGSQLMHTVTALVTGLSMGSTILVGHALGSGDSEDAGNAVGNAIWLFGIAGILLTAVLTIGAEALCRLMHAPQEAFGQTVSYVFICAAGSLFIVAYNVLGSIFRGMGDSKTPLLAVAVACVVNIVGDLIFVSVFNMAAAGAALATVLAQGLSVTLCLVVIRRRGLSFPFEKKNLRFRPDVIRRTIRMGAPIALQDLLVSLSFLAILVIINRIGVIASAGMGVAEKLCAFIMLVPSAFSQSLSAFVAQNVGAGRHDRARRAMLCGMLCSFAIAIVLAYLSFFHGEMLASIFSKDLQVNIAAADYLKGYAIDVLLVSFLFCFIGYFNGCGHTGFVMLQGLSGAFGVRIPVSWLVSRIQPTSLFRISLATPCSTVVQIVLCVIFLRITLRREQPSPALNGGERA